MAIEKKTDGAANCDGLINQVRLSTRNSNCVDVNKANTKVNQKHSFFRQDSDSDLSESEVESDDKDCDEPPPQTNKQKHTGLVKFV